MHLHLVYIPYWSISGEWIASTMRPKNKIPLCSCAFSSIFSVFVPVCNDVQWIVLSTYISPDGFPIVEASDWLRSCALERSDWLPAVCWPLLICTHKFETTSLSWFSVPDADWLPVNESQESCWCNHTSLQRAKIGFFIVIVVKLLMSVICFYSLLPLPKLYHTCHCFMLNVCRYCKSNMYIISELLEQQIHPNPVVTNITNAASEYIRCEDISSENIQFSFWIGQNVP